MNSIITKTIKSKLPHKNTDGSVIKEKEINLNSILADLDGRIAALETV